MNADSKLGRALGQSIMNVKKETVSFFNLNTVNNLHSFIKNRCYDYQGVATKYLNRYNLVFRAAYRMRLSVDELAEKLFLARDPKRVHHYDDVKKLNLLAVQIYSFEFLYYISTRIFTNAKGFNDLATTHADLAAEWAERNYPLMPDEVNAKSRHNIWWKCKTCGNEWKSVINARVKGTVPIRNLQFHAALDDIQCQTAECLEFGIM